MARAQGKARPLLKLMHRPEVDKETKAVLPPDKQDKRSVVPVEVADWDQWLHGSVEEAESLIRLPELGSIIHTAADPTKQVP